MLAAANAHQQRYYNTDLIDCIKVNIYTSELVGERRRGVNLNTPFYHCIQILDGRIYEQVKDYLVSLCQTELEAYQAVHNIFNQILNSSNGVSLKACRTSTTSHPCLYQIVRYRDPFVVN